MAAGSSTRPSAERFRARSVAVVVAVMRESRSRGEVSKAGVSETGGKKAEEEEEAVEVEGSRSFLGRLGGGRLKVHGRLVCLSALAARQRALARSGSKREQTHRHSTQAPPSLVIAHRFLRFRHASHGRIFLLCSEAESQLVQPEGESEAASRGGTRRTRNGRAAAAPAPAGLVDRACASGECDCCSACAVVAEVLAARCGRGLEDEECGAGLAGAWGCGKVGMSSMAISGEAR